MSMSIGMCIYRTLCARAHAARVCVCVCVCMCLCECATNTVRACVCAKYTCMYMCIYGR